MEELLKLFAAILAPFYLLYKLIQAIVIQYAE